MVKRDDDVKSCSLLPRRRVVERTNGWIGRFRILSKEYERTIESSRADVLLAMTSIMPGRLGGATQLVHPAHVVGHDDQVAASR